MAWRGVVNVWGVVLRKSHDHKKSAAQLMRKGSMNQLSGMTLQDHCSTRFVGQVTDGDAYSVLRSDGWFGGGGGIVVWWCWWWWGWWWGGWGWGVVGSGVVVGGVVWCGVVWCGVVWCGVVW